MTTANRGTYTETRKKLGAGSQPNFSAPADEAAPAQIVPL